MQSESTAAPANRRGQRPRSFVIPLLLVIVGLVLLFNNLGVLPWSIWTALGQLWPAILILIGIDLIVGRRSPFLGATITMVAFVAVIGAAVWLTRYDARASAEPRQNETAYAEPQPAAIPLEGATAGDVTVHFGAGNLHLSARSDGEPNLVQTTSTLPPGVRVKQTVSQRNGTETVTVSTEGTNGFAWPFRGFGPGEDARILETQLAPNVPLTLRADVGAGQSDFDLTGLLVRSFTLNNGAGQATVHFPSGAGTTTADIHSGAGQIVLEVPPDVGAYVHGNSGFVNVRVPTDRYQKVGDGYQTADYQSAKNRVDVSLHVGVGEVDVQ
jgi:hypothetical protein